ncbi:MAG: hypothetical protein HN341_10855 [Verrucomicrobia bacterium]|jgi:hypothetical protein|nr:hypothetical protein [Verrucomicrobiota bacterium]
MKRDITVPLSIVAIFVGLPIMMWFSASHPYYDGGFGPPWMWPIFVLFLCGALRTAALWLQSLFHAVQSQSFRSVIGLIALGPFGAWIYYFRNRAFTRNEITQPQPGRYR